MPELTKEQQKEMIKICKKRSRLGMDIDNNTLTERELFKIKIKYEI